LPGAKKAQQRRAAPVLAARLNAQVALQAETDGNVAVRVKGYSQPLGKFAQTTLQRLDHLRTGLPLASIESSEAADKDIALLIRRLALIGLLEYRLGPPDGGQDQVTIEPQMAEYWPGISQVGNADTIALSRFAYWRRRGKDLVLESPLAGALFVIADARTVAALATLAQPQKIGEFCDGPNSPALELLGLLLDCRILFKLGAGDAAGLRSSEGDPDLVLWDFHDLLFHTRSTDGRQANPIGGLYSNASVMPPLPAARPPWPGQTIDLNTQTAPSAPSSFARLLHGRHSIRDFDDDHPITLAELAAFLQMAARIRAKWTGEAEPEHGAPEVAYASRPYPSGGASYELELYLAVVHCDGLARGFYHYDSDRHALTLIGARPQEVEAQLEAAALAIGASHLPQILITIAARFGRVSWKYTSVAYSLILKDVGVLMQTLYLTAADMGLGGCAIGTNNIDQFAKMTGLEFHVEGSVGQFVLGRPRSDGAELG
jgi:SagB-type dehydrogenase family enzyme